MSTTQFAEVTSSDPYVQKLGRRAIRLLNDTTLERWQREKHIRDLQQLLLEHQAKQAAKANRLEKKKQLNKRPQSARAQAVADTSQITARRKEFAQMASTSSAVCSEVTVTATVVAKDAKQRTTLRPILSLTLGK